MKIFVYGTLKKGKNNHHYIDKKIEKEITLNIPGFLYWKEGRPYPHFISNKYGINIEGEIYDLSEEEIKKIDKLEGHPFFFKRKETILDGEKIYYYEYVLQKNEKIELFKVIEKF